MIKIIKELNDRQKLVEENGNTFVVSQSRPDHHPVETLVFRANANGKILNFTEVGGEVGVGIDQFLEKCLQEGKIVRPWELDDLPW